MGRHSFLFIFLLFVLTFLVILPVLCNRLKYSFYYGLLWPRNITEENQRMNEENNERLAAAYQEFRGILDKIVKKPDNTTDVVITLITVSRETRGFNPYYLTQTVGKLLQLLKNDAAKLELNYGLMVCNVDPFPKAFKEAWKMLQFLHGTVKYPTGLDQANGDSNRFEKEKQDYVYCLEKSLQFQPKYVLLMEDDAYPTDQMLLTLEYSIQNVFEGKFSEFFYQRTQVAYLKLYHPERLLGFISLEIYRLFELAGAVSLLLIALLFLFKRDTSNRIVHKYIILSGIYMVFLALTIGRPNLTSFRKISPYLHTFAPAPSCCTPANLYSNNGARAVIDSLSHKVSWPGYAKDTLLDEFLKESGYNAIYVEPNIFKHIGQYSSLRQGQVLDPYVV